MCRPHTKHLVADHESSESSRKDNFRQRFSVTAHPSSSLLACSDGYHLTILRWDASQDLLGVVLGFVGNSRKRLGLSMDSHHMPKGTDDSTSDSRHDIRNFIASIKEGSELPSKVLAYSPKHPGGYLGDLAGLEAGEIHFAGASDGFDLGRELVLSSDKESLNVVICLLQATLGMLLSCEPFVPCNGMLPRTKSLELDQVAEYRSQLQAVTNLLVSAVAKVVADASALSTVSPTQPETVTMTRDFTVSLLRLVSLDKLKQSHMDLSLALANTILRGSLSGLVERHCDFVRLDKGRHTLCSLQQHVEEITGSLRDVHNLLEEIVYVLESTYSNRPLIFSGVHGSSQTKHAYANCMIYLSPSLKIVLNLICVLWNDVKFCKGMAKSIRCSAPLPPSDPKQGRSFKGSSSNARGTIKGLYFYIHNLLASSWYQRSASKQVPLKDGKPITYITPHRDVKLLLDGLLQYELKAVVDLVNGCIQACDDGLEAGPFHPLSTDQLSDVLNSSVVNRLDVTSHICVRTDQERFVVGALGDLMAAYFTDKKLLVLLSSDASLPLRHAELSKSKLATVLRDQDVLDSWTAERAVNLLLLSGQWDKACDFVVKLGDWRKAFILATFFTVHSRCLSRWKGVPVERTPSLNSLAAFSHNLALGNTMKIINGIYGSPARRASVWGDASESMAKTSEPFLSETFSVCALVQVDSVLTSCAGQFLKELIGLTGSMGTRVHPELYLPAPPLYCVQLAATQEVRKSSS